jgi:formimidoylglutamate deiminase
VPAPQRNHKPASQRPSAPQTEPPLKTAGSTHPSETGWLPDYVYTGEKFESGVAFFADALGRITRFSREPADLSAARRLAGQAALPGLIDAHASSWQRVLRGRTEQRLRAGTDDLAAWRDARNRAAGRLRPNDVFDASRMAFMEMMLAGITCVGEFHDLPFQLGETTWDDPMAPAREIARAAHEVGIRIALFNVATMRAGPPDQAAIPAHGGRAEAFLRETESLRREISAQYPADEAWLGVAPESVLTVSLDELKAIASYAHAQRMRVQMRIAMRAAEVEACVAEYGRSPIVLLSEAGIIDKRFVAVHGSFLSDEECGLLGAARATVCVCPVAEQNLALRSAPVDALLAAGAGLALGTATEVQSDLLKGARLLEYGLRVAQGRRPGISPDAPKTLFHAATVTGARSLGATGGALEVGRPADFFTVNLYEPSIAGAEPDALLANVMLALERRGIREVWVGARQRVAGGRHPEQGAIVGRFVELQKRLWSAA